MVDEIDYLTQSKFSDAGKFSHLYDDLPKDIESICAIIRGLIVHQHDTKKIHGFDIPKNRELEPNTRYVSKILERITHLQDDKLSVARKPKKRFIGLCRDFAILLCSILRYKGVQSRLRCGFANYYEPGLYVDHWLCEYWHQDKNRWILVDTEVDKSVKKQYKLKKSFDSYDVKQSEFITSGKAWRLCRDKKEKSDKFGVHSIGLKGLWFVVGNLHRDLAALNKIELLPWDYIKYTDKQFKTFEEMDENEIKLADKVAEAIMKVYENPKWVVRAYNNTPEFRVKRKITSYTSVGAKKQLLVKGWDKNWLSY